MKLYKNPNNNEVFAFEEDGSQDALIHPDLVAITQVEANALIEKSRQQLFGALNYAQKRALEYPPIADYIDGVVKGDQAQIDAYIAACLAVKERFPKP